MNRRRFVLGGLTIGASPALASPDRIGLIFVAASWCPVCKQAAPVLALFSEQSGIPVLVASQDNRPIPPFADAVPARDHPVAKSILHVPTILVFDGGRDEITSQIIGYRNPRSYLARLVKAVNMRQSS